MERFKNLIVRLVFGWEAQSKSLDHLNISELYSIHSQALPESTQEARTRAELSKRKGTIDEWIAIYRRSYTGSWAEDLSLQRIRQARATYEEWYRVFSSFPPGSPLKKIAEKKMKSTSRS
jgi:hypothetical protein